jgi:hypothetical protein
VGRGGVVRVRLACPAGGARCRGTLRLGLVRHDRRDGRARTIVLGRARYALSAGRTGTVRLHLSRAARRALRGHRRAPVTVVAVGAQDRRVTLRTTATLLVRG